MIYFALEDQRDRLDDVGEVIIHRVDVEDIIDLRLDVDDVAD